MAQNYDTPRSTTGASRSLVRNGRAISPAEAVTAALRGGWYDGYGMARCPAHRDENPSLSIGNGHTSRVVMYCFAGCTYGEIMNALRARGLNDLLDRIGSGVDMTAVPDEASRALKRQARIARARAVLAQTVPAAGTLVERYLRNRAIRAATPPVLHYLRRCPHPNAAPLPAMVAEVTLEGEEGPVAIHRTFIAEPGRKANVEPVKAMRGPTKGGAVRLSDGPGPLVVTEGIETALSLLDALEAHRPRVWAALSANGVGALRLPAQAGELIVAPDPDPVGEADAQRLAQRAHRDGWRVRILPPPGPDIDWNDEAVRRATT